MGDSRSRTARRSVRVAVAGAAALLAAVNVSALASAAPASAALPGTTVVGYPGAAHVAMPSPTQLLVSADGSIVFATSDSDRVVEFSTKTESVVRTITLPDEVSHLALTPSGALDAITVNPDQSGATRAVYIIDPATGAFTTSPLPSGFEPRGYAVSGDGRVAAALTTTTDPADGDRALRVAFLDPESGAPGKTAYFDGPFAPGAVFSPDGRTLYAFDSTGSSVGRAHGGITPIDVSTLAVSPTIDLTGSGIGGVQVSPDGTRLFAASFGAPGSGEQAPVDVIDTSTDSVVDTLWAAENGLSTLDLSGDGSSVVASGDAHTLVIDTADLATRDLSGGQAEIVPGTDHVVTGFGGGTEYDASTGQVIRRFGAGTDYRRASTVLSPDDRDAYFASATAAGAGAIGHLDMAIGDDPISTTRLAGPDLLTTNSAVVDEVDRWRPQNSSTLYVASDTSFTDSLSAATAAIHQKALVLLTDPKSLSSTTAKEISTRGVSKVVIVGSTDSVSNTVVSQVKRAMQRPAPVVRLTGADRYATSRALVKNAFGSRLSNVWIATGVSPADALASASAAGHRGQPLLVVNGGASTLDAATWAFLVTEHASSFTVVGSTSDVSAGVATSLAKIGPVTRIAGTDPVDTSQRVNDTAFPTATDDAVLANASSWQDQLIGSQLAGALNEPLELVTTNCVPDSFAERLTATGQAGAFLIGGTPVLGPDIAHLAAC